MKKIVIGSRLQAKEDVVSWIEIAIPAAIGAVASLAVAIVTMRHQYKNNLRDINSKMQSDINEWKLKFAELSAGDVRHARAAAQQLGIGILIVRRVDPRNSPTMGGDGYSSSKFFVPKDATITIGRSQESYIHIDDARVSKTHAFIEANDDHVVLRDVSTNGTFINDAEHTIDLHVLKDGDVIRIGNAHIAFRKSPNDLDNKD